MPPAPRTALLALLTALLAAPVARAQVADSAAADSTGAVADTAGGGGLAADSVAVPADSMAAAEAPAAEPHVVPSLAGLVKVAVTYRDMVRSSPGEETQVEIWRGPQGQVLRFVTGGRVWAVLVRPAGGEAYTLRDHDCSGAFGEELQAGTPLAVPDCAIAAADRPAVDGDD